MVFPHRLFAAPIGREIHVMLHFFGVRPSNCVWQVRSTVSDIGKYLRALGTCSCASSFSCACAGTMPANIDAPAETQNMRSHKKNLLKQHPIDAVCLLERESAKDIGQ